MSHECGCRTCQPADALIRAEMEEHRQDFERFWEAMHRKPLPPLPADHETNALLRLVEDAWPTDPVHVTVRRVG